LAHGAVNSIGVFASSVNVIVTSEPSAVVHATRIAAVPGIIAAEFSKNCCSPGANSAPKVGVASPESSPEDSSVSMTFSTVGSDSLSMTWLVSLGVGVGIGTTEGVGAGAGAAHPARRRMAAIGARNDALISSTVLRLLGVARILET